VLDTFTRTESPLSNSANWVGFRHEGATPATGATNGSVLQLAAANPSIRSALWHTVFAAAQQDVFADITVIGSNWLELWLAEESESAGYSLEVVPETAPKCKYVLLKNHSTTLATVSGELEVGDSLWLNYVEATGVLTVWRKHAGAWAKVTEFTDTTPLKHGGRIGFAARCNTAEWQLDNFGGGGEAVVESVAKGFSTNSDFESAASAAAYALASPTYCRVGFAIGASAAEVAAATTFFNNKGISCIPMAGASGRIATSAEAKALKAWAEAIVTKGGQFIEFENETNYQIENTKANGKIYGERAKEVGEAINGTGVKVLVQGSDAGKGGAQVWLEGVLEGWPKCWEHPAFGGWTIHPYPGQKKSGLTDEFGLLMTKRMMTALEEAGDTTSHICATEWGETCTANGRKLNSEQEFNYEQAAKVLEEHHVLLASAAKGRLFMLLLFQPHDQKEDNGTSEEREWFFGAMTNTGATKGSFTTFVQKWLKGEA
jgi:hypothetical protein